jgi:hypothetical protein
VQCRFGAVEDGRIFEQMSKILRRATLAEKPAVLELGRLLRLLGQNNSSSTPVTESRRDINCLKIVFDF